MPIAFTPVSDPRHGACLEVSNGFAQLLVPLGFGLRVLRYSRAGGENLFYEQQDGHAELTTPQGWRIYGGHRLWAAPESERVYYPDNEPIGCEETENGVILRQKADPWLHIQKEMELILSPDSTAVTVVHRVANLDPTPQRIALWAITAVRPGGEQRIPFCAPDTYMAPNRRLVFWSYTDPADERMRVTEESISLSHRPLDRRLKIGVTNYAGEAAYEAGGDRFTISYRHDPSALYPDGGVSYETFLCRHMTEMETLSPLYTILQGETKEHVEQWEIADCG